MQEKSESACRFPHSTLAGDAEDAALARAVQLMAQQLDMKSWPKHRNPNPGELSSNAWPRFFPGPCFQSAGSCRARCATPGDKASLTYPARHSRTLVHSPDHPSQDEHIDRYRIGWLQQTDVRRGRHHAGGVEKGPGQRSPRAPAAIALMREFHRIPRPSSAQCPRAPAGD